MKYYEVYVNKTSKAIGSKEGFSTFDYEKKSFDNLQEVKDFLKEQYGNSKRVKMYIDDKEGNTKHVGYIYHFRNKDWSHNSEEWIQEDWIEVRELKATTVII